MCSSDLLFDDNEAIVDMLVEDDATVTCDAETVFCDGAANEVDIQAGAVVNGCDISDDAQCKA